MNTRSLTILCLFILAMALVACGATPTTVPGGGDSNPAHLIVALNGQLSVKRIGWTDYAPAVFGMALRNGDLLRVEGGGLATVACADLTLARAAGGVSSVPCKVSKPLLTYRDSLIVPTRADPPIGAPIILSPRKTKVLTAQPTLRWMAAGSTNIYDVSIRGGNLSWTTRVNGATEIVYPADAPALQPGASYKLVVTTSGRSSDEETEPGLGFTMLKADEAQAVLAALERIRSLGLAEPAQNLLIANLYASQGLHAEAIAVLQRLTVAASEPALMRTLGDLYLKVSLIRQAENAYLAAAQLSERVGDIEGMAASHNTLGLVYETLGNRAEAIAQTSQAIAAYQKLGDAKTVQQMQERLASLQK